jgi:hypothetical protein
MGIRHLAPVLFVLIPAVSMSCDTKKKMVQALGEAASAQLSVR